MRLKLKLVSFILIVGLLIGSIPVGAQAITPLAVLGDVEQLLYGQVNTGAIMGRLEQIENEVFGQTHTGPVMTRIDRVQEFLVGNKEGTGLKLRLNLAEWGFLEELTESEALLKRLERLEVAFYGDAQVGSLSERIDEMMMLIWGTTDLDYAPVETKSQTLVEIQVLSEVDSSKNKVGDLIHYHVASDVIIDDWIAIPKGAKGIGKVTEVTSAGALGRNGRVVIDFGTVPAFDGSSIRLRVSERATEENSRLEIAAGASMAGILLLGPIGLAGGYFIKGENVRIPSDTRFFVETENTRTVLGFNLLPAR